jgi:hypothetical protein
MAEISRNTCEIWMKQNPVLALDVIGYDTTHDRVKIGDGVHCWNDLVYIDSRFNADDIIETIADITETLLPKKANASEVYTKDDIDRKNFVTARELGSKNYMSKDEARIEFLPFGAVDGLVTRKDLISANYANKSMLEDKADKSEVYTKTDIDKKLLNIICHDHKNKPSGIPCPHNDSVNDSEKLSENSSTEEPCNALFDSIYTKGEVDTFLEKKADRRFIHQALSLKADTSYVDGKLESDYYTITEIDNIVKTLTGSDISSFVTSEELETLNKRLEEDYYSKAEVDDIVKTLTGVEITSFVSKDDFEALNESLDVKADKDAVDEALSLKADNETITKALEEKADKSSVEKALEEKATKLSVEYKADTIWVEDELKKLQDQVDMTYSSEILDTKLDAINTTAIEAKKIANDCTANVSNNYVLNSTLTENVKQLDDKISTIGNTLNSLIQLLIEKGVIAKGELK